MFEEIHRQRPEAVLMLIGRGEMESVIRRKVNRRGLQDAVLFLGNRRKIERYYQAMDAFVLPSRYEGLPVVGVEAQACH